MDTTSPGSPEILVLLKHRLLEFGQNSYDTQPKRKRKDVTSTTASEPSNAEAVNTISKSNAPEGSKAPIGEDNGRKFDSHASRFGHRFKGNKDTAVIDPVLLGDGDVLYSDNKWHEYTTATKTVQRTIHSQFVQDQPQPNASGTASVNTVGIQNRKTSVSFNTNVSYSTDPRVTTGVDNKTYKAPQHTFSYNLKQLPPKKREITYQINGC